MKGLKIKQVKKYFHGILASSVWNFLNNYILRPVEVNEQRLMQINL
jgi:hypothetical protein